MQIIDIYIGKVKKEIYKLSPAEWLSKWIKSNLIEYSEDNPNCTMGWFDWTIRYAGRHCKRIFG